MARRNEPFDSESWLSEAAPPLPLPIHDRYQPVPVRPFGNPVYLAGLLPGAVESPVMGSTVSGYGFRCLVCNGHAKVSYGFPPEGPFHIECNGICKPGELREALSALAPLAFEARDDVLFAIPKEMRDSIVAAGLKGDLLLQHKELNAILRSMRRKGGIISLSDYTGPDGQTVLLLFRQDFEGGFKRFWPVHCYVDASDGVHLSCGYPKGLLPLFNWNELTGRNGARVLLTEGEKAAAAAQRLFPDLVATTSSCGSPNSGLSDWSTLHDRDVVIWHDNDDAGAKYEKAAAAHCMLAGARSVRRAVLPSGLSSGWDLADPLPDHLKAGDLAEAIDAGTEISWEEVKDCLAATRNNTEQPPFRFPDGYFARHKKMRAAVAEALQHLDPGRTRSPWVSVLSTLHHAFEESGFEMADEWSKREAQRHGKYRDGEVRRIFDAFNLAPLLRPMPVLYLFRMAMKESRKDGGDGWTPPDDVLALANIAEFDSQHRKITQGDNISIGIQEQLEDGSYVIRQMKEKNAESLYLARKAPDFDGNRTSIFKLWRQRRQERLPAEASGVSTAETR